MRHTLRSFITAATLTVTAAPLAAQVVYTTTSRGWIGVSFEALSRQTANGVRTVVTVTDVIEGGPAADAGVRPGDVVVSINDRSWEDQFGGLSQGLRPGDPVRLVVERSGQRTELRMTAAPRPAEVVAPRPSWSVTVRTDSMADFMYRAMDSLRVRLVESAEVGVALAELSGDTDSVMAILERLPAGSFRVLNRTTPERVISVSPYGRGEGVQSVTVVPGASPPFNYFMLRKATQDSLRQEMDELSEEVARLRSQRAAQTRALAARSTDGRIDRSDAELRVLDEALHKADGRLDSIHAVLSIGVRQEAGKGFGTVWLHTTDEAPNVPRPEVVRARPLAPYALGENRAAGAEVVDLQPELAAYFNVAGGVLVVDVAPGTPAAMAGLQPGDVVTKLGDRDVRNIQDLREALSRSSGQFPLTLVRKGKQLQVLLRR